MDDTVFTPMPPKVAQALSTVMGKVQKLEKGERNIHANYAYAGIESFLEMLRPLFAAAGLIIVQDEESYEFREGKDKFGKALTWLVITYSFGLIHSSGETWGYRCKRTSMVQASMGSQAFGAGQSFALKLFLRSIGLIATGDTEDADSHEQRDLPPIGGLNIAKKSSYRANKDKDWKTLKAGMDSQDTVAALKEWADRNQTLISQQPDNHQGFLREAYLSRMTELREGVTEDGMPLSVSDDLRKQLDATDKENALKPADRFYREPEPGSVEPDEETNP